MKKLYIRFADVGIEHFEFLENTTFDIDIVDNDNFYLNDMATGARILGNQDILECLVTSEQETALILRFGDKISEKV
jgi:hypothetical protein